MGLSEIGMLCRAYFDEQSLTIAYKIGERESFRYNYSQCRNV